MPRNPRSNPKKENQRGRRADAPPDQEARVEVLDKRGGSEELTPQELTDRLCRGICYPHFRGKQGPQRLIESCRPRGYNPTRHPFWNNYLRICGRDCS